MARYRRNYKKPARSFGSRVTSAVGTAAKVASTAAKVYTIGKTVANIAGMVNAEKNYLDTVANTTIGYTGTIIPLSQIPQGDDVGNRQGNSVLLRSIYLRFTLGMSSASTQTFVRMIIFIDKFNTGTTTTVADVLAYDTGSPNGNGVNSPLNVDHTVRYRVLQDKIFALSINGRMNTTFKKYMDMKRHMHYTGSAGTNTYGDNIYMLLLSNEPTNTPTIFYWNRVGYYDN